MVNSTLFDQTSHVSQKHQHCCITAVTCMYTVLAAAAIAAASGTAQPRASAASPTQNAATLKPSHQSAPHALLAQAAPEHPQAAATQQAAHQAVDSSDHVPATALQEVAAVPLQDPKCEPQPHLAGRGLVTLMTAPGVAPLGAQGVVL
jgi:hypothetical protein